MQGMRPVRDVQVNSEQAIRAALRNRHLRHYGGREDVLIIDELGLAHSKGRVDLAVINGHFHGYEIKSAGDTLERLSRQISLYAETLQKITFVVATRHLATTEASVPEWCGLIEIVEGPRGGIAFANRRRACVNLNIDPFMLAHLLWHSEAQNILRNRGVSNTEVNAPRKQLYRLLADKISMRDLVPAIKAAMASRTKWRDLPRPS